MMSTTTSNQEATDDGDRVVNVEPSIHDDPYARLGGVAFTRDPVRVLVDHHDEATAYRHGATRWWIETRPGWGQRLCRQAPHLRRISRGAYYTAAVLFLDDAGGVRCAYLTLGSGESQVAAFARRFAGAMTDRRLAAAIAQERATR